MEGHLPTSRFTSFYPVLKLFRPLENECSVYQNNSVYDCIIQAIVPMIVRSDYFFSSVQFFFKFYGNLAQNCRKQIRFSPSPDHLLAKPKNYLLQKEIPQI